MRSFFFFLSLLVLQNTNAQQTDPVWQSDQGNGNYKNPILHADYSDPDVVRVGDDFYMISSSFNHSPGLPILHSKDLINWKLIGHALQEQVPFEHYSRVQHGNGVWAPSIRYHKGEFYIYYPDPDFGIYLIKAKNIKGPWSAPILVEAGRGLIDPCPLWDDDGKVYLVHALAGSRAGIKSIILVKQMNTAGTKVIDRGRLVYDGHDIDPTIEGPKFHKRNGWYYIFAPAGGVSTGWQLVLRSKNIYGPYERKVVMHQGNTDINGPHQGAWVDTKSGEDWFIHFQDKEAYGRIVHLQPMKWVKDWPVIGNDPDADGTGEPVLVHSKPTVGRTYPISSPPSTDEFNGSPGLQWQWQANPGAYWGIPDGKNIRLYAIPHSDSLNNPWSIPNLFMQKFPAEEFSATAFMEFKPLLEGEKGGMIVHGATAGYLALEKRADGNHLIMSITEAADKGKPEKIIDLGLQTESKIYMRLRVNKTAVCQFSYSSDGKTFQNAGDPFTAKPGRWVGAKMGIFSMGKQKKNDSGYLAVDWFRVSPL